MSDLEHNKQTVVAFYTRSFNDKQPADAVARYVGTEYIQHNPQTADGADAFIQATNALIAEFPELSVEIKRVIAEADLVVTHDLIKTAPGDRGLAGIDIFRLENGDCRTLGCSATGSRGDCKRQYDVLVGTVNRDRRIDSNGCAEPARFLERDDRFGSCFTYQADMRPGLAPILFT